VECDGWAREIGGRSVGTRDWGAITERRLVLPSGLELDVGIGRPAWARTDPPDPGTLSVVRDGITVLHDPDGLLAELTAAQRGPM
jgi:hypothetical protein